MLRKVVILAVLGCSACLCVRRASAGDVNAQAAELVSKLPAPTTAEGTRIVAGLVELGPPGVQAVCDMLRGPGRGKDAKARFALHGMAMHVSRPGAEAERKMLAGALAEAIDAAAEKPVKAFLIYQLQLIGRDAAVGPLSPYLGDEKLCEPATRALTAIRTPGAAAALVSALPGAKGKRRATLIRALGALRAEAAAPIILTDATAEDAAVRRAALYALANMPAVEAADLLAQAARAKSPYERARATSFYLLFAGRLAEVGKTSRTVSICRELIDGRTGRSETQVVCAALRTLVDATADKAMPDLLAAADSPNEQIRQAALNLADRIPGKTATAKWLEKMQSASPAARVGILGMLARRGDRAVLPVLQEALQGKDKALRLAAIPGVAHLGGSEALPSLLGALRAADSEECLAVMAALIALRLAKVNGTNMPMSLA